MDLNRQRAKAKKLATEVDDPFNKMMEHIEQETKRQDDQQKAKQQKYDDGRLQEIAEKEEGNFQLNEQLQHIKKLDLQKSQLLEAQKKKLEDIQQANKALLRA